jgi:hypothetical protein
LELDERARTHQGAARKEAMRFLALGIVVLAIGWPTVSYAEA